MRWVRQNGQLQKSTKSPSKKQPEQKTKHPKSQPDTEPPQKKPKVAARSREHKPVASQYITPRSDRMQLAMHSWPGDSIRARETPSRQEVRANRHEALMSLFVWFLRKECQERVSSKSVQCQIRVSVKVSSKNVKEKCSTRVSRKSAARVSSKSVKQECQERVTVKSIGVQQECPSKVSSNIFGRKVLSKRVKQECPAKVSSKRFEQRVSSESVKQEQRVSRKSVKQDQEKVSSKSVQQECPARVPSKVSSKSV